MLNKCPYTAFQKCCPYTCVLTVMAGSSRVTSVIAVAVECRPGLGTVSSMFTVVWQTPNGKYFKTRKPK